ncbi:MAG: hypothetical protein ACK6DX_19410, partial [Acidobacteriota bacterium]
MQLSGSQAPVVTTDTATAVETIYPQNRMNVPGHDAGGYVTGMNGGRREYDGVGLMMKNTVRTLPARRLGNLSREGIFSSLSSTYLLIPQRLDRVQL